MIHSEDGATPPLSPAL